MHRSKILLVAVLSFWAFVALFAEKPISNYRNYILGMSERSFLEKAENLSRIVGKETVFYENSDIGIGCYYEMRQKDRTAYFLFFQDKLIKISLHLRKNPASSDWLSKLTATYGVPVRNGFVRNAFGGSDRAYEWILKNHFLQLRLTSAGGEAHFQDTVLFDQFEANRTNTPPPQKSTTTPTNDF